LKITRRKDGFAEISKNLADTLKKIVIELIKRLNENDILVKSDEIFDIVTKIFLNLYTLRKMF